MEQILTQYFELDFTMSAKEEYLYYKRMTKIIPRRTLTAIIIGIIFFNAMLFRLEPVSYLLSVIPITISWLIITIYIGYLSYHINRHNMVEAYYKMYPHKIPKPKPKRTQRVTRPKK